MDDFEPDLIAGQLTANQRRVLAMIRDYLDRHGHAPSLREIAEHFGLKTHSSAQDYVEALVRKGALERAAHHRGLRVRAPRKTVASDEPILSKIGRDAGAQEPEHTVEYVRIPSTAGAQIIERSRFFEGPRMRVPAAASLPLVGRVAAGSPIMSEGNIEASYAIDPALFRPRADFLLRVVGMSMRDAGILDGDLLAVHRTPSAENGRIVVARLDDEITVKRLQRRRDRLLLLPENPDFEPIEVDPRRTDSFAIEGVYAGIIRRS